MSYAITCATDVAVSTSSTTVCTISIPSDSEAMAICLTNTGAVSLSACAVSGSVLPDSPLIVLADDPAEFSPSTLTPPILGVRGSPISLAPSGSALIMVDVRGLSRVRITAAVSSGSTTVSAVVRIY